MPLIDTGLLARYFLDEAASGTAPLYALDKSGVGSAFNVPITYAANLAYTEISGNRGLDSTSITSNEYVYATIASGNKIYDALHGSKVATLEMVLDADDWNIGGARSGVHLQQGTSGGRLGIQWRADTTHRLYFNDALYTQSISLSTGARNVIHLVLDTGNATANDRARIYFNGTRYTGFTWDTNIPQDETLDLSVGTLLFSIMNRDGGSRQIDGQIFYAAIYSNAMAEGDIAINASILANDDDESILTGTKSINDTIKFIKGRNPVNSWRLPNNTVRFRRQSNFPKGNFYTMAGWLRHWSNQTGVLRVVMQIWNGSGGQIHGIEISSGNVTTLRHEGGTTSFSANHPVDGTWFYAVLRATGNTVEGLWKTAESSSWNTASGTYSVLNPDQLDYGNDNFNTWGRLDIAYPRVWNTYLNDSQLDLEMNSSVPVHREKLNTAQAGIGSNPEALGRYFEITGGSADAGPSPVIEPTVDLVSFFKRPDTNRAKIHIRKSRYEVFKDNFDRPNEDPLRWPWIQTYAPTPIKLINQQVGKVDQGDQGAYWGDTDEFPSIKPQYAQAYWTGLGGQRDGGVGVLMRSDSNLISAYIYSGYSGGRGIWRVIDGANWTRILDIASPAPVIGDLWRIEYDNGQIRAYVNGVLTGAVYDIQLLRVGSPGIFIYETAGVTFDNFEGGLLYPQDVPLIARKATGINWNKFNNNE